MPHKSAPHCIYAIHIVWCYSTHAHALRLTGTRTHANFFFACMPANTHARTHACKHARTHARAHTHTRTHTHTHAHTQTHTSTHRHHRQTDTHAQTHTHTHTKKGSKGTEQYADGTAKKKKENPCKVNIVPRALYASLCVSLYLSLCVSLYVSL